MERTTITNVAKAERDLEHVLYCQHHHKGKNITLRFVKATSTSRRFKWTRDTSSTNVREAMQKKRGRRLKEALAEMALSPDVLWHHRSTWMDAARESRGRCINFPSALDEDVWPGLDENPSIECQSASSTRSNMIDVAFLVDGKYTSAQVSKKDKEQEPSE